MFNVFIRQEGQAIQVEVGSTILETALAAGIDYPHGCRAGNCGGCKSRIHSGEIELSPYSEFALSEQEFEDGLILACRAVPWSDCEVSWLEQDDLAPHQPQTLDCSVSGIEKLTRDIVSVKVSLEKGQEFHYSPGQFVYITFQGMPRREYSIAIIEAGVLEFYIRVVEGGVVSPFVWDYLAVNETVQIDGPYGNMFYRSEHQGPVLAVAGGSGLSAIQPVAIAAVAENPSRDVHLYHGVRDELDVFREETFQQLSEQYKNFRYVPVLSQPSSDSDRRTGMLSDVLAQDLDTDDNLMVYLAGPPPMVRSCTDVLLHKGVKSTNIHADPFFTEADQGVVL